MGGNGRSRVVTEGVKRAPNHAMLRAMGFGDDDFGKPVVGEASGHSTITPCNVRLNVMSSRAAEALREAGAMPQARRTI